MRIQRYPIRTAAAATVLALSLSGTVQAASFCVGTDADLRTALNMAENNADSSNAVRIKGGSYGPASQYQYSAVASVTKSLFVLGHYNSNCTALGDATVFNAGGNTDIMRIDSPGAAQVVVQGITFLSADSKGFLGASALAIFAASATVRLNIFFANNSPEYTAVLVQGTDAVLSNNEFLGNTSFFAGAAVLDIDGTGYVTGNTVVSNSSGLRLLGPAKYYVSNNILWNNGDTGPDLFGPTVSANIELRNNDIGIYSAVAPGVSIGNVSVAPQFMPGLFNVRLAANSPLIDAGLDSPPGGNASSDLDYETRIFRTHIDIGAYESRDGIFDDGFEPPPPL